jgi:phosphoribosylaminoimidazole (AIR) synthetase
MRCPLVRLTFAYWRSARRSTSVTSPTSFGRAQSRTLLRPTVGTKLLVAQAVGRFDRLGSTQVAMNVNDVLCVGARPVALVDYIAVGGYPAVLPAAA